MSKPEIQHLRLFKEYMINTDELWMREALKEARYALQSQEIPIGAIVVHNKRIIARAHNQVERLKDVTAHAEMIAITSAANYIGGKFLNECELYVTLEPCIMCIGAVRHARFRKIVFGAYDNRHLMPGRWDQLLQNTEIVPGILEQDCQSLLHEFFQSKRSVQ